ncbi:MAG: UDP-N-acetylmuramate--L-alanine ligase, partial [Candidatus Bipolaricaulota bacterium]
MSGLASLLRSFGARISGSDLREGRETERLRRQGIPVHIGHDARHVPSRVDAVIVSSAIPETNVELATARARGIPVVPRLDALRSLLALGRSVGIAGTHGKTSTVAMLTEILRFSGYQPSFYAGG